MKVYSTLLLLILIQSAYSQVYVLEKKYKNHLEAANLSGKVKRIKEVDYASARFINDSIKDAKLRSYSIMEYNRAGNLIERKSFRSDQSLAYIEQCFYNEKQQLIKLLTNLGTDASSVQTTVFKYDAIGNKIEESSTMFNGATTITQKILKHDSKRRVIEMIIFYPGKKETDKRTYRYDDKNNLIEQTQVNASHTAKFTYKYPSGEKTVTIILSYPNNKPSAGTTSVTVTTYDRYKNLVSSAYDKGENGKPDFEYSFDFDAQGNWIRMFIVSLKNKGSRTSLAQVREIEYY